MASKKLTRPQLYALDHAKANGSLKRYGGGYWAKPGLETTDFGGPKGVWWPWATIKALIDRDLLVVTAENRGGASKVEPAAQRHTLAET